MEPFTTHTGRAVSLRRSNVDTDQIIPSEYLKRVSRTGFGDGLFATWRADPGFVLNRPESKGATMIVESYLVYLGISLAVTVSVAYTLHRNGRVFLVDAFHGNDALADSVNHMLVVGFYLINVGYIALVLRADQKPNDCRRVEHQNRHARR